MGITFPSNIYGSRKTPVSLKIDITRKQAVMHVLLFSCLCSLPRFVHHLISLLPCFPASDACSVLTLNPISCIRSTTKTVLSKVFQVATTKFTKFRASPSAFLCVWLSFFPFHYKRTCAVCDQTLKGLTCTFNTSSEKLNYFRTRGSCYFYIHCNAYQIVCLVVNSYSI